MVEDKKYLELLSRLTDELEVLRGEIRELKQSNYSDQTYGEWLDEWLRLYKKPKCKLNYYNAICGYIRKYILPCFGSHKLKDVSPIELQSFLHSIDSDCTRTQIGAVLSSSFGKAYDLRLIPFNPYNAVDFKHYEPPTLGALRHSEYELVLSSISDSKKYALTWLLLATGLRQGEALALTKDSFDLKRKILRVEHSLERGSLAAVKPKTRSGVRSIPIEDPLIELILPYLDTRARIFCENTPDTLSRYYRRLFKRLDMPFSGHIFRHTFITNCYELQVPDYIVQRWVGHSKRAQADTYLALRKADEFINTDLVSYMLLLRARVVAPMFV